MDISFLESVDTYDLIIKDPRTFKPTDVVITLLSPSTDEYQKAFRRYVDLCKDERVDVDQLSSEFIASLIKGWKNLDWDGEPLECNDENKIMLVSKSDYIKNEIDQAVSNKANFIRG